MAAHALRVLGEQQDKCHSIHPHTSFSIILFLAFSSSSNLAASLENAQTDCKRLRRQRNRVLSSITSIFFQFAKRANVV